MTDHQEEHVPSNIDQNNQRSVTPREQPAAESEQADTNGIDLTTITKFQHAETHTDIWSKDNL